MKQVEDLTGQKFNAWTVLEKVKKNGRTYWLCQCECGTKREIQGYALKKNKTKSCGCQRAKNVSQSKLRDYTGQKFGRLTAIRIDHREPPKTYWLCKCDCGKYKIAEINSLTQGHTKSCGCLDKENKLLIGQRNYHDLTGQRFGKLIVVKDSMQRTKNGNVLWECKCDCGNIKNIAGTHLLNGDTVSCGCINSKGEFKIQQLLNKYNINFIQQHTFNDCVNPKTGRKLFFDFYLPDFNRCIEFDGEQHYNSREEGYFTKDKVKEIQERDAIKTEYCKKNNIDLIRILWYNIDNIIIEDLIKESNE